MLALIGIGVLGNRIEAKGQQLADAAFDAEYEKEKRWDFYSPKEEAAIAAYTAANPDTAYFPADLMRYVVAEKRVFWRIFTLEKGDISDKTYPNRVQTDDCQEIRILRLKGPHWKQIADRIATYFQASRPDVTIDEWAGGTASLFWNSGKESLLKDYQINDLSRQSGDVMVVYSRDLYQDSLRAIFKKLGFDPLKQAPHVIDYSEICPPASGKTLEVSPSEYSAWEEYSDAETAKIATYAAAHPEKDVAPESLQKSIIADLRLFFKYTDPATLAKYSFYKDELDDPICPFEQRIFRVRGLKPVEVAKTILATMPAGFKPTRPYSDAQETHLRLVCPKGAIRAVDVYDPGEKNGEVVVSYERRVREPQVAAIEQELGFRAFRIRPSGMIFPESLCPSPNS